MNKTLFINLATFSKVGGIENYNKNIIRALSADCELDVVSIYDSKSVYNEKCVEYNKNNLRIIVNKLEPKSRPELVDHITFSTVKSTKDIIDLYQMFRKGVK